MTTTTEAPTPIHTTMYEKSAQSYYRSKMYYAREEQTIIEGVRSLNMDVEEMSSREFFYDDDNDTKSTETNLTGLDDPNLPFMVFKWDDASSAQMSSFEEDRIPLPVVVTKEEEMSTAGEEDSCFYDLPPVTGLTDSLVINNISSTGPADKVGFVEDSSCIDHVLRVINARSRSMSPNSPYPCSPLNTDESFSYDICDSQMDTPTCIVDEAKEEPKKEEVVVCSSASTVEKGSQRFATHGLCEAKTKQINLLCKAKMKELPPKETIADDDLYEVKMDDEVVAQYCTKCGRFTKGKSMHTASGHVDRSTSNSSTNSQQDKKETVPQQCQEEPSESDNNQQQSQLWHSMAVNRQLLNRTSLHKLGLPPNSLFLPHYQVNLSNNRDRPLRWRVPIKQHKTFPTFPSNLLHTEQQPSIPIFWVKSRHGQFTNDTKLRDQLCYYVGHYRFCHSKPPSNSVDKTSVQAFFAFEKFDPCLDRKLKQLATNNQKRVRWSYQQQQQQPRSSLNK